MTVTDPIRPMDELREHRDALCENLAENLDFRSMIADVHTEIDNELAEVNHGAVEPRTRPPVACRLMLTRTAVTGT